VVLEPSCASVFRDELTGLFPHDQEAQALAGQTLLLSEFLVRKRPNWQPPRLGAKAIVQGHCHHKSVLRFDDEAALLGRMGVDFDLLASGCCGMAGAFGFEAGDKVRVSMAEGERVLLPAVRNAEASTVILADGFSCRTQIAECTARRGLHVAQLLALGLSDARPLRPGAMPEARTKRKRAAAIALSMAGAACMLLGAAALGFAGWRGLTGALMTRRWTARPKGAVITRRWRALLSHRRRGEWLPQLL
jgi:hypothetical protein